MSKVDVMVKRNREEERDFEIRARIVIHKNCNEPFGGRLNIDAWKLKNFRFFHEVV